MSAIETYLQYIANKVWARDVRTAIVNAIRQCYDDVHNPTLNTEALQAAIQAKIDAGQMAALTIGDRTITAAKLALGVIPTPDTTLSQSGVPADAKKTGDEITALKADLDDANESLDDVQANLVDRVGVFRVVPDRYINLTTDPVNFTPVTSETGLAYSIIDCIEGDVFVINAVGATSGRAWGFLDSGNHVLSMADSESTVENLKITAPENAVKLVINDRSGGISYKIGNSFVSKTNEAINTAMHSAVSNDFKNALLDCFQHLYFIDDEKCLEALEDAMYEDAPTIYFTRNRGTRGELIVQNDARALSELVPFNNEAPITIRVRLNSPFAFLGKFEATDGSIITTIKPVQGTGGYFFNKENRGGVFGWTSDSNEYVFKNSAYENVEMESGVNGKTLSNRLRIVLSDIELANDASSSLALPQDPISGLLEVQGKTYKIKEENYPIITVTRGRGTSGETIVDNEKRAITEPIPFNNEAPIDVQISVDGDEFMYLTKFTDSEGDIIIDTNNRTPNNVQGWFFTYNNSRFGGFSQPKSVLTFKEEGTLIPSALGQSATGQTPSGHFVIIFANANGMDEPLPDTPITGIVDVQGVKYKLVTSVNE